MKTCKNCGSSNEVEFYHVTYDGNAWQQHACNECVSHAHRDAEFNRPTYRPARIAIGCLDAILKSHTSEYLALKQRGDTGSYATHWLPQGINRMQATRDALRNAMAAEGMWPPYPDEATEWTVCPRCQTQIALDDYQEAAGMCDACLIDTTPEPPDPYEPFWQRLEREYAHVKDELDRDSLAEHLASVAVNVGKARHILGTSGLPTTESERRLADDELGDALARCGLLIHTLRMAAVTAAGLLLALSLGGASAAETIQGRERTYPFVGTPAYSDSCIITEELADGTALAYCWEDGATMVYDADGQPYANIARAPIRAPGWYPVN